MFLSTRYNVVERKRVARAKKVVSIAIHPHGKIHQTIMSSRTNEGSPGSKADYTLIHQVMGGAIASR